MRRRLALLLLGLALFYAPAPAWAQARFFAKQPASLTLAQTTQLASLARAGIEIDIVDGNGRATVYLSQEEFKELTRLGYAPAWEENTALLAFLRHEALGRQTGDPRLGYHTYDELAADLTALAQAHPDACRLASAGLSAQGRELYGLKITDNVDIEEDEPEFFYIGSMHGDEPIGLELLLDLAHWLLENRETDAQANFLVNETEIWLMPLMNPDGLEAGSRFNYNGVDLNRDFPDPVVGDQNTTDGRQPETVAVMNWFAGRTPALAANLHGGALVVTYPWDNIPSFGDQARSTANPCQEEPLYIQLCATYALMNGEMATNPYPAFAGGYLNGSAWYPLSGGLQDWTVHWYGAQHVTMELSRAKTPPAEQIPSFIAANRGPLLWYMRQAHMGVRGLVRDAQTLAPIAAQVSVSGLDHLVWTDPDVGDYHRPVMPGEYELTFQANGYQAKTVGPVNVPAGEDGVRVDVLLNRLDNAPPQLVRVSPAEGAQDVSPDIQVTAVFNEPLDPASLNAASFYLETPARALVAAQLNLEGGDTARLTPLATLSPGLTYTARLTTGLADLAGNHLTAEKTWSFTTSQSGGPAEGGGGCFVAAL